MYFSFLVKVICVRTNFYIIFKDYLINILVFIYETLLLLNKIIIVLIWLAHKKLCQLADPQEQPVTKGDLSKSAGGTHRGAGLRV